MPRKTSNAVHRLFEWDEQYSSCKLCENKLKGNHATNLMNHLRLKHEDKYNETVEINKGSVKLKGKKNENENEKEKKRKRLLDCCIKLIAVHGRPFEILEDKAFRDIKALISSDFVCEANSKKNKQLILDKAFEIKNKIAVEIKQKLISVKLDSATCMDRQFMGINIQYIKDSKIIIRNLALKEIFVSQTAENLKEIILEVLGDFQIHTNKIYSVTTDNGSNYLKLTTLINEDIRSQNSIEDCDSEDDSEYEQNNYLDDHNNNFDLVVDSFDSSVLNDTIEDTESNQFQIPSIRCAAHILQLCIKDSMKKNPETEYVIESCRNVVKILRRPLMKIKINSLKLRKPILDCTTRWASTFNMLKRLKELKTICDDSEEILETVGEHFWSDMNSILECLHPAAEATIRLQAEQLTLGDFYSIWTICKNKTEKLSLPLAREILTSMEHRENLFLVNKAFLAAIFIDPRWKIILSDQETEIAKNWLKDVHRQIFVINQEREAITHGGSSTPTNPVASCSRNLINLPNVHRDEFQTDLQSLDSILNETLRVRAANATSVRLNFTYYLAEYATVPRLSITENVIEYWTQRLPNKLAEVALVVLAAPATQVSVERLFSTLKFILTPSRNRLLDQTIKSMVLIKCNEDLFDD